MTNKQIHTALQGEVTTWMGTLGLRLRPESFQYVRASILTSLRERGVPVSQQVVDSALRVAKYPGYEWQA